MHWRSIHGKRLLGDKPLGLPAQKGWEFHSPLSGSHHPRLSGKFVADSVFIDAFKQHILNLPILYHGEASLSIQWKRPKNKCLILKVFHSVHRCTRTKDKERSIIKKTEDGSMPPMRTLSLVQENITGTMGLGILWSRRSRARIEPQSAGLWHSVVQVLLQIKKKGYHLASFLFMAKLL